MISPDPQADGLFISELYLDIVAWLVDMDLNSDDFNMFVSRPSISELIKLVLDRVDITELDKYNMLTPSKKWPEIMEDITNQLQALVSHNVTTKKGRTRKIFKPEIEIPYRIYRNLLELPQKYQQENFGFYLDFNDAKKDTLRSLHVWLDTNYYAVKLKAFLMMFMTCYLSLDAKLKRENEIHFLDVFWKLPLNLREEERIERGLSLFKLGSWVYHPLTDEEDQDFLLGIGQQKLETERTIKKKNQILNATNDETRRFWILNAEIKMLILKIESTIQQMNIIAKNYNALLAADYFSQWTVAKERKKRLQEESDQMLVMLTDLEIYDIVTNEFSQASHGVDEHSSARNAVIGNARALFRICDIFYGSV